MIKSKDEIEEIFLKYGHPRCGFSVEVRRIVSELIDSHNEATDVLGALCLKEDQLIALKNLSDTVRLNTELENKTLMMPFKKFYAECLRAGIDTQPLIRLLSTLYAQNMVTKGFAAMIREKLWNKPIRCQKSTELIEDYAIIISRDAWSVESYLGNIMDSLETK